MITFYRADRLSWSRSTIAGLLRGTLAPQYATAHEWLMWEATAKAAHPIRYWLAEVALDEIQKILYFPYDLYYSLYVYIQNRFVTKTHILTTGLEPGKWYDFDTRLMHGMFDTFVDFIECDQAGTDRRDVRAGVKILHQKMGYKMGDWMDYEQSHPNYYDPSPEALSAQEQYRLYNWWKVVRPSRADPYELYRAGILSEYDEVTKMEKEYDREDEEMMMRLIKIREYLWT
jgi:hypothetical protein